MASPSRVRLALHTRIQHQILHWGKQNLRGLVLRITQQGGGSLEMSFSKQLAIIAALVCVTSCDSTPDGAPGLLTTGNPALLTTGNAPIEHGQERHCHLV